MFMSGVIVASTEFTAAVLMLSCISRALEIKDKARLDPIPNRESPWSRKKCVRRYWSFRVVVKYFARTDLPHPVNGLIPVIRLATPEGFYLACHESISTLPLGPATIAGRFDSAKSNYKSLPANLVFSRQSVVVPRASGIFY
jgi:hypothetical protein